MFVHVDDHLADGCTDGPVHGQAGTGIGARTRGSVNIHPFWRLQPRRWDVGREFVIIVKQNLQRKQLTSFL